MSWFDQLGNFSQMFPDVPALAFDMALNGPDPDHVGYGLAYGIQTTPEEIPVYPQEEPSFLPSGPPLLDGPEPGEELGI